MKSKLSLKDGVLSWNFRKMVFGEIENDNLKPDAATIAISYSLKNHDVGLVILSNQWNHV